jgi:hypothetical protein
MVVRDIPANNKPIKTSGNNVSNIPYQLPEFQFHQIFLLFFQSNLYAQASQVDGLVEQGKKVYGAIAVLATKDGEPVYQKELGEDSPSIPRRKSVLPADGLRLPLLCIW